GGRCHEDRPCESERDALRLALDPDLDRRLVFARGDHRDPRARQEAAALELAKPLGVVVGDTLDDHLLARGAVAEGPLADRPDLARKGGDGVAVRVELGPAEKLEDALLHPLRDDVLEALRLVVNLVPAVAENADEEHLEQPVMTDELECDLATLGRQLLAAISVVLDEALRGKARDHLAHARRRDAESLGQLTRRDRALV